MCYCFITYHVFFFIDDLVRISSYSKVQKVSQIIEVDWKHRECSEGLKYVWRVLRAKMNFTEMNGKNVLERSLEMFGYQRIGDS